MTRSTAASKARESGSALVEFALVIPLFFLIVFGLVELAIVFAGYCGAQYASQICVRYAIVRGSGIFQASPTNAQIAAVAAPYLWAAQPGSSSVTAVWNPNGTVGSTVTVSITLTYKIGIPFWGLNNIKVGTSSQGTILF